MGHDEQREIFERLEALERLVRARSEGRGPRSNDRDRGDRDCGHSDHRHHNGDRRHDRNDQHRRGDCDQDHGGNDFDEKRVIDLIVRLVSEQVGRVLQDQQARAQAHDDDDGGEKRIVDLIVGLVSEHVQEIVATELDRRFGPTAGGERPPLPPPAPRGGPGEDPA